MKYANANDFNLIRKKFRVNCGFICSSDSLSDFSVWKLPSSCRTQSHSIVRSAEQCCNILHFNNLQSFHSIICVQPHYFQLKAVHTATLCQCYRLASKNAYLFQYCMRKSSRSRYLHAMQSR